ncbi:hypothetical protein [Aciduliprofundum sp. MAR08-339]|uniref:hypothetical protein n=1 Tax=Aciduliprofundum sp. (strain MAR08-339) TaxID=673860 RepID=UPI0030808B60
MDSLIYLAIALILLLLFARSKVIARGLRYIIKRTLRKFTKIHPYDYELLLGLSKGYTIRRYEETRGSQIRS